MVVVAAIDRSKEAKFVIEEGMRLAEAFNDSLHVIHAVPSTEFAELQREHVSSTDDEGGMLDRDDVAAQQVRELVGDDTDLRVVGLDGEPAESIIEYAEDHDARYIVVGGRKHSRTGKAIFGSTTQSVLLDTDHTVVVEHLHE